VHRQPDPGGTPLVVVLVPARSSFLAIATEVAKTVFDERLANPGLSK